MADDTPSWQAELDAVPSHSPEPSKALVGKDEPVSNQSQDVQPPDQNGAAQGLSPELLAFHQQYQHHSLSNSELAVIQQHLLMQASAQYPDPDALKSMQGGGDPLAYQQHQVSSEGHLPAGPELEFEKDRKEKRKVANREAARRMRQRRADQISTLGVNVNDLKAENAALQQQLTQLANHNRELMAENAALKSDLLSIKQALDSGRIMIHPEDPPQEGIELQ